jgi:hypothetical protein
METLAQRPSGRGISPSRRIFVSELGRFLDFVPKNGTALEMTVALLDFAGYPPYLVVVQSPKRAKINRYCCEKIGGGFWVLPKASTIRPKP